MTRNHAVAVQLVSGLVLRGRTETVPEFISCFLYPIQSCASNLFQVLAGCFCVGADGIDNL